MANKSRNSESPASLKFTEVNAALGAAGMASLFAGYWLLAQGSITVAPLLLVEKDTPGFTVGRKLKKMGWWKGGADEAAVDESELNAQFQEMLEDAHFTPIFDRL